MEHCAFLNEILTYDSIRYAAMFDSDFKMIVDGNKPGILPYLSRDEQENSVRYDIRRWETYKMFHNQLGESKYAMVKFEKATLLTFSLSDGKFLRLSIEPNADYQSLINRVSIFIENNPKLY